MAIDSELKSILGSRLFKNDEVRDFVPVSYAHRELWKAACEEFPDNTKVQFEVMAKYSPIVDWFIKPRSIESFQILKMDMYKLHDSRGDVTELARHLQEKIVSEDPNDFPQPYLATHYWYNGPIFTEQGIEWQSITNWTLDIANQLKIISSRQISQLPFRYSPEGLWNVIEGNKVTPNNEVVNHDSLNSLVRTLENENGRRGLIFGDFRVGDTTDHDQILNHAKLAVGKKGSLIVVTPTRKTILNTTQKTDSYNDEERLHRLRNNRNVDHLLMLDMPEGYWQTPSVFWVNVWKKVAPNLIFLGEKNHPLQPIYEAQSRHIGSLLLIDDKPVSIRSGDLLKIKTD